MEILFYVILIIIIIICLIAMFYIIQFNKFQKIKIRIDEAETIIDEQIRTRYDTLSRLSSVLQEKYKVNNNYFKDFNSLKDKKISNFDMDRKITETINFYKQIKQDLKNIEDDDIMLEIDNNLKISEEKLEAAKYFYNSHTSKINALIKSFPSNIIAKMHGMKIRNYFDNKDLNDDDIKDFKI